MLTEKGPQTKGEIEDSKEDNQNTRFTRCKGLTKASIY